MRGLITAFLACVLLAACGVEEKEDKIEAPPERWVVEELGTRAEFRDVFFLDEQHGWIVGGGVNITGGIIGTTVDGGRTWRFDSGIARPSPRAGSVHLNAVWFLDRHRGFIVGDGYQILRTRDGGKQWHRVPAAVGVWAHLHDLEFVDDTHGWAIGDGGLARTVDGGETWRGPLMLDPEDESPSATRGQALSFVDPYWGWLVGKHGLIRFSNDGGQSWELLAEMKSENPDLWAVEFVDYRQGWAVGARGTILHTTDGGKSWQRQSSGVRDTLTDVDFSDENRGWVVGFERDNGTAVVLRTSDGGESWTEQARVGSEEMRSIYVLDERHAWAVGQQQRRGRNDGTQKLLRYEVVETE
jgi:photosystem II stability/assembly factor-like uncharacterized protein